jgi:hypothetical protein
LASPDKESCAEDRQGKAESGRDRAHGSEVDEAEKREPRKQERGDHGKEEAETLHQVSLCVGLRAYGGHAQIDDEEKPQGINEPDGS